MAVPYVSARWNWTDSGSLASRKDCLGGRERQVSVPFGADQYRGPLGKLKLKLYRYSTTWGRSQYLINLAQEIKGKILHG